MANLQKYNSEQVLHFLSIKKMSYKQHFAVTPHGGVAPFHNASASLMIKIVKARRTEGFKNHFEGKHLFQHHC